MYRFKLKIPDHKFHKYALNYQYQTNSVLNDLSVSAKQKGYLTKTEFLKICSWKTPRSKPLCVINNEEFIREITFISFKTKSDQLRIEILRLLKGVSWPTASAILHFCHKDQFPILDFRALYTLGYKEVPKYNYSFWKNYTEYCRILGNQFNLDLRSVDRALWQFSKEHQNR